MMSSFFVYSILILFVVILVDFSDTIISVRGKNGEKTPYTNCKGKTNQNLTHPNNCTKYLTCKKGEAFEWSCPSCPYKNCSSGMLFHFNEKTNACDWPERVECKLNKLEGAVKVERKGRKVQTIRIKKGSYYPTYAPIKPTPRIDPTEPTSPFTTPFSTTEFTTTPLSTNSTDDPTDNPCNSVTTTSTDCDYETTEPYDTTTTEETPTQSEETPTTDGDEETTTPINIQTTEDTSITDDTENPLPPDGTTTSSPIAEDCDPETCKLEGYCRTYKKCNLTTRKWTLHKCGIGLFWNSEWNFAEIGGSCDQWDNLSTELQGKYRADLDCFPIDCFFEGKDQCSGSYVFHPNGTDLRFRIELKCPPDLIWDDEQKTCNFCENVKNSLTLELCKC